MTYKIGNEFYYKLIHGVRGQPCLFEKKNRHYYNRNKRNEAWKAIAIASGRPASDCKARWKLLRERFCKQMKKAEADFSMETDMQDLHEWEYYKEMLFLKKFIVPRRPKHNKDLGSSLEEPAINEVFINIDGDESFSSNSNLSKGSIYSFESYNKTTSMDTAPLKIELIRNVDSRNHQKPQEPNKSPTVTSINMDTDNSADELFAKNIANLMRDLPIEIKDRFQADMYAEVFRLRTQYRNY